MTMQIIQQTNVRVPQSIRDRLKMAAERNRRSFNAEIVIRLEASLNAENEEAPGAANTRGFDVNSHHVKAGNTP